MLSAHIAGLVRDELAGELTRHYEAGERSQAALRRLCAEAADPGDNILGSHRFSCGPRVEVVLKAVAAKRPDLLDRDGRPTDAIWAAFGAEVAAGDLGVMEDPQESIEAVQRFLESTVAGALDGLTLDALYTVTGEPPDAPSWIGRAAACLQTVSREKPYRVRLAQVPAATSDALYDQILRHTQTVTRSEEENRLLLTEFTYAYCADELLSADPRGLKHALKAIRGHTSNPQLAQALEAKLAALRAVDPGALASSRGSLPLPGGHAAALIAMRARVRVRVLADSLGLALNHARDRDRALADVPAPCPRPPPCSCPPQVGTRGRYLTGSG